MVDSINCLSWQETFDQFHKYVDRTFPPDGSSAVFYLKTARKFEQFLNTSSLSPDEAIKAYYLKATGKQAFCRPDTQFHRHKARVLQIIWDIRNGTVPKRNYGKHDKARCPSGFLDDLRLYRTFLESGGKSPFTVRTYCRNVMYFFVYLDGQGCRAVADITPDLLLSFISGLEGRYSAHGRTDMLYAARYFFAWYCAEHPGTMGFSPLKYLSGIRSRKHERLCSFYTADEVRAVMGAVDRGTPWGKTIYLMMLLACVYGLRSSDIKSLRLDSIHWASRTITLSQHKTQQAVSLPITDEVMYALLDYLKNTRPAADFPEVFITLRHPHMPYSMTDGFSDKMEVYFKKAGVNTSGKHRGLHSLRHSLATGMAEDGVPVNEIASVLGHSSAESTKTYIWDDIEHLRRAGREVPPYEK